jgi:hypothetical protein
MATYRCLASGNTVTFTQPHDIESMKGHGGYVRIDEEGEASEFDPNKQREDTPFTAPAKPRGRPRRVTNEAI